MTAISPSTSSCCATRWQFSAARFTGQLPSRPTGGVLAGLARLLPRRHPGSLLAQPATVLRWHRALITKRPAYPHAPPGRPGIPTGTTTLVLRLAKQNPTWGYRRTQGEPAAMGITIAPPGVWAILKPHGADPPPQRSGPASAQFLAAQAKGLMARLLPRRHRPAPQALRARAHPLRHALVRIAGVTAKPAAEWVTPQARNLSMELPGQAAAARFLIRDRDIKFTASLDAVFAADAVRIITTPVRAPPANATCERVIGTTRRECPDRTLIPGRRHLQAVLIEYAEHYNAHRPHRSLNQRAPSASMRLLR